MVPKIAFIFQTILNPFPLQHKYDFASGYDMKIELDLLEYTSHGPRISFKF